MTKCPACGAPINGTEGTCNACGACVTETTQSFAPVVSEESEIAQESTPTEGPVLVVRKGPDVGERFYLDRHTLSVGRDPRADIFLNDVTVSREHATLTVTGSEVSVIDVGSLNGTYINGVCVDKAILGDGDVVQIGTFQMVFLGSRGE